MGEGEGGEGGEVEGQAGGGEGGREGRGRVLPRDGGAPFPSGWGLWSSMILPSVAASPRKMARVDNLEEFPQFSPLILVNRRAHFGACD